MWGSGGGQSLSSRDLRLGLLPNVGFLAGLWAALVVHRSILIHMELHLKVKQDCADQFRPVRHGFHARHTLHGQRGAKVSFVGQVYRPPVSPDLVISEPIYLVIMLPELT